MRWYCAQFATDDVSTLALCSSAIVWMAQQKPAQLEWSADQVMQLPNGDRDSEQGRNRQNASATLARAR